MDPISDNSTAPETLSPTRVVDGVSTAPLVSAEQEIAQLRDEVARLRAQLEKLLAEQVPSTHPPTHDLPPRIPPV